MFVLRRLSRSYGTISAISAAHGNFKVSPAAYWHAKFLGISLEGVKGTGPKGHILKSDILQIKTTQKEKVIKMDSFIDEEVSFLIDISSKPSDQIIKKCIESITKLPSTNISEVNYKTLPQTNLLQFHLKTSGPASFESEKIKNLLKMYLNDSSHLLL